MSASILIVEDHRDLAQVIAQTLEDCQFIVDFASNGDAAILQIKSSNYDLVILDLMLPGIDGLTVCQYIRKNLYLDTPVLMLTAKDTLTDKLTGFAHGADDYLVKPFEMPELLARVQALLKRKQGKVVQGIVQINDLVLDSKKMHVSREGVSIDLSPTSFSILQILMRESPNIVTRAQLEQELWGEDLPDSDALRSHIYSLRKAIDKPFDSDLIETLKGRGFRLRS